MKREAPVPVNSSTQLVTLKTYVDRDEWADVMDRAQKAGMSVSKYLRALITRDELDADGRPVWAPRPSTAEALPGLEAA